MALQISITLPCKPYVAHYLRTKFGSPCQITRACAEGKLLFSLLENARHETDKKTATYTDSVEILLADGIYLRHGWEFTPTGITEINNWLEDMLKQRFRVHVDALLGFGIKKSIAIRHFQFQQNFPEHVWKYETLKKYHDRRQANCEPIDPDETIKLVHASSKRYTYRKHFNAETNWKKSFAESVPTFNHHLIS